MAPGIPDSLEPFLLQVAKRMPKVLQVFSQRSYQSYVCNLIKFRTWFQVGRDYNAPIKPLSLNQISPKKVKYRSQETNEFFYSDVRDGNWDQDLPLFSESTVYKSFLNRFKNGKPWEQTKYYKEAIMKIKTKGCWRNCTTKREAVARFEEYDDLYKSIQKHGYKSQSVLESEKFEFIHDRNFHPPELREITVDIGRSGAHIWVSGQHRLAIAKIQNIEHIPVRVRTRHKQWQEFRDNAINSDDKPNQFTNHPDLKYN